MSEKHSFKSEAGISTSPEEQGRRKEKIFEEVRLRAQEDAKKLFLRIRNDTWQENILGFVPSMEQVRGFCNSAQHDLGFEKNSNMIEEYYREFRETCQKGWPSVEA